MIDLKREEIENRWLGLTKERELTNVSTRTCAAPEKEMGNGLRKLLTVQSLS